VPVFLFVFVRFVFSSGCSVWLSVPVQVYNVLTGSLNPTRSLTGGKFYAGGLRLVVFDVDRLYRNASAKLNNAAIKS